MKINYTVNNIVLQATSLCNMNCKYCYLPNRDKNLKMLLNVTQVLSEQILNNGRAVKILWHSGEPLAVGVDYFRMLVEPFEKLEQMGLIEQRIQTNATLINDEWITLFLENNISVGVSIDGPELANTSRVDWKGKQVYKSIINGIDKLKKGNVPYGILSVIDKNNVSMPNEIFDFFCDTDCSWVGFNIEEKLGSNNQNLDDFEAVKQFFQVLFSKWLQKPKFEIREFNNIINWLSNVVDNQVIDYENLTCDLFPTIGHNGDFVFIAPEFLDEVPAIKSIYDFKIGNIFEDNLFTLSRKANNFAYVEDYSKGVESCSKECKYFGICRGGVGGNKYFEKGTTNTTETIHCINSVKIPSEIIFQQLNF